MREFVIIKGFVHDLFSLINTIFHFQFNLRLFQVDDIKTTQILTNLERTWLNVRESKYNPLHLFNYKINDILLLPSQLSIANTSGVSFTIKDIFFVFRLLFFHQYYRLTKDLLKTSIGYLLITFYV